MLSTSEPRRLPHTVPIPPQRLAPPMMAAGEIHHQGTGGVEHAECGDERWDAGVVDEDTVEEPGATADRSAEDDRERDRHAHDQEPGTGHAANSKQAAHRQVEPAADEH